jgi:adenosylcobinamide-phosphate synthase
MMGYRNEKYEWLGKFAARLDDILNFIPSRLSGLLIVLAAFSLKDLRGASACRTMFREHRATSSPNAGWTMSAAAGALLVRLVKIDHYTIEGGSDLPSVNDVKRAVRLIKRAMLFSFILLMLMMIFLSGIII